MTIGERKTFIPIFVGSTFTDLQYYRRAVRDALAQLETIVRGMEHFGSKPGTPVEECLNVVRSCSIYIGIFGMRYGSIPEGYDKSMTQLEYDEAQRLDMPSLIYIIDEENQPLLPKHVETGSGANKLKYFKGLLKKKHVVSFFTTPEDLRAKILHDVPEVLKKIGADISGDLGLQESYSVSEILMQFELLPKIYSGREVTVEFKNKGDFRSAFPEDCKALGLEPGASIYSSVSLNTGQQFRVFGERDIAMALSKLKKNEKIVVRAVTVFGSYNRVDWTDDGPLLTPEIETGLIIKEIFKPNQHKEIA